MATASGHPPTRPVPESYVDGGGFQGQYDLFVIGGGSGGLACAKAASSYGAKVGLCDFVKPSPQGTTWGLGGTCVNVGCIPKKLMHTAGLQGHHLHDMSYFGWKLKNNKEATDLKAEMECDWATLRDNVNQHVKSLNFGYRIQLPEAKVEYHNALATFTGPNTVALKNKKGEVKEITARRFVIAVGGRPQYPDCPGFEHGITSDDLFTLKRDPGKTLCVGASYVSLECAGFLTEIGRDVTVAIRSIPLRGFDVQCAENIVAYMRNNGTKFLDKTIPVNVEKLGDQEFSVTLKEVETGREFKETYNTVLWAVGRNPDTTGLGLESAGVKLAKDGKIITDAADRSSTPHIYAIGDVAKECLELTPVAVMAGKLLASRLYNHGQILMDYHNVPTTVFTPIEYGSVGYTEEKAEEALGENLEVFHTRFVPLEWTVPHRGNDGESCYMKVLVDKSKNERVVGFHILTPNAGEITQAVALAMRLGATKQDLDLTVGIHPTVAEGFTTLTVTKSSGVSAKAGGC